MSLDPQSTLYALIGANILIYLLFLWGILRARARGMWRKVQSIDEAFSYLEVSLKNTFPDLPEGFTWKEIITRLQHLPLESNLNWEEVEAVLKRYEAYRYGGMGEREIQIVPILRLANSLPKKGEAYATGS